MKVVLVTGCSSGFGRVLVSRFLERGWTVLASMRRAQERESLFASERLSFGKQLKLVELDVTSKSDREAVCRLISSEYGGKLDCLVNNAGYGAFGALEDFDEVQIRAQLEVNFFGLALLTRDCLPFLRPARGRVINLSSVLGFTALPLSSLYCASKYAVEGLTESLRYELAAQGVRVGLVEPGSFKTQFVERSKWGAQSFEKNSPYLPFTKAYRKLRDSRSGGKVAAGSAGFSPVVDAVLKIAESRWPPFRIRCGTDAKIVYRLKKFLPDALFLALNRFAFRKLFQRPKQVLKTLKA